MCGTNTCKWILCVECGFFHVEGECDFDVAHEDCALLHPESECQCDVTCLWCPLNFPDDYQLLDHLVEVAWHLPLQKLQNIRRCSTNPLVRNPFRVPGAFRPPYVPTGTWEYPADPIIWEGSLQTIGCEKIPSRMEVTGGGGEDIPENAQSDNGHLPVDEPCGKHVEDDIIPNQEVNLSDVEWVPKCFLDHHIMDSQITGWVKTEADLNMLLGAHRNALPATYVSWHNDATIRQKMEPDNVRPLWKYKNIPDSGVPFLVTKTVILQCQYGKGHKKKQQDKHGGSQSDVDHNQFVITKKNIQTTRKVNCEAKITIKFIQMFPDYEMKEKNRLKRQSKMDSLKQNLKNARTESTIFVSLPLYSAHTNHRLTVESDFANRMNPKLKLKLEDYVSYGITNTALLKRTLHHYVTEELSRELQINPRDTDRAFYPTSKDISNHVHRKVTAGQMSSCDQRNLDSFITICRERDTTSKFKYITTEDLDTLQTEKQKFLFVHQQKWQQDVLLRYGNTMSFLDATYKTTKYALPLFLLCVRTNIGYVPAAVFITEDEQISSIASALKIIKDWNPLWSPSHFMTDYSEMEFAAIREVFPEAQMHICSFHREQAWERWSRDSKNGLSANDRIHFLQLMRAVAHAPTKEELEEAIDTLKNSQLYQQNKNIAPYVENKWLKVSQKWCRAQMDPGFHLSMRTNNGVESLNKTLKYIYLQLSGQRTLRVLVQTLIECFIPDMKRRYHLENYRLTADYKKYDTSVPKYLHNRPHHVIQHCMKRMSAAEEITPNDINCLTQYQLFEVKSYSDISGDLWHKVSIGNNDSLPNCTCYDFQQFFLPCKHMFAIFNHTELTWDSFPASFKNNVFISIDVNILSYDPSLSNSDSYTACDEIQSHESTIITDEKPSKTTIKETADNQPSVSAARQQLRVQLKLLEDCSFICTDVSLINNITSHIETLRKKFNNSTPKDGGLPLLEKPSLRKLPARKRKKKTLVQRHSGRVGMKASEIQEHTIKGLDLPSKEGKCAPTEVTLKKNKLKRKSTGKHEYTTQSNPEEPAEKQAKKETAKVPSPKKYTKVEDKKEPARAQSPERIPKVPGKMGKKITFDPQLENNGGQGNRPSEDLGEVAQVTPAEIFNRKIVWYIEGKVGGEKIYDSDLKTLQGKTWLNDKIVEVGLKLALDKSLEPIFQLYYKSLTDIVNGNVVDKSGLFWSKVCFTKYKYLAGIYHKDGDHWTLLIFDMNCQEITFMDPKGESDLYKRKVLSGWRNYVSARNKIFRKNIKLQLPPSEKWSVRVIPGHIRQPRGDTHNCGLYTIHFAKCFFLGESYFTPINGTTERLELAKQILGYRDVTQLCRKCGSAVNEGSSQEKPSRVMQCSCGRYIHFKCLQSNERKKTTKPYKCLVCNPSIRCMQLEDLE